MKNAIPQFTSDRMPLGAGQIYPVYKQVGLTPLEAARLLQHYKPELAGTKIGYAGRLDPLAEGVLLVLAGRANRWQEHLSHLDKRYSVSCILGITTDSYDLLGIPKPNNKPTLPSLSHIGQTLANMQGQIDQPYPPYSAVRVKGKPLYWWARNGRLTEIDVPSKQRWVKEIRTVGCRSITAAGLLRLAEQRIGLVKGDFRQPQILAAWQFLSMDTDRIFVEVDWEVECSSGTYVRGLVEELGQSLGSGAVTSKIIRTAVGRYTAADAYLFPAINITKS